MLSLVVIRAQEIEKLASFYSALGLHFPTHRHVKGPEHLSSKIGEMVFEIYPSHAANESTVATRLGFSVSSLTNALDNATVLAEPSETPFGHRAVVMEFEGHKVEL